MSLFGHTFPVGGPLPGNLEPSQLTAKYYLEKNLFPQLEKALNELLETIEKNGEFEKYVEMLAERQEREQKELRRRERDRRKLQQGDDYQSSDTEGDPDSDDEDDDDSNENEGDSEDEDDYGEDDNVTPAGQKLIGVDEQEMFSDYSSPVKSPQKGRGRNLSPKKKQTVDSFMQSVEDQFNPLRFLGITLRDICEQAKKSK